MLIEKKIKNRLVDKLYILLHYNLLSASLTIKIETKL